MYNICSNYLYADCYEFKSGSLKNSFSTFYFIQNCSESNIDTKTYLRNKHKHCRMYYTNGYIISNRAIEIK